jgi:acetylornithine deacetylase/succinyl-diaminopimelate desuccinylase-like protein
LCAVDSSICSDINKLRNSEKACFRICQEHLASFPDNISIQMLPINTENIRKDPDYTIPYYASHLKENPEKVYKGRCNMLASTCGDSKNRENRWILNAHIDTVSPHVPPNKTDQDTIRGRGTADNKGGVAVAILVFRLLREAVLGKIIPKMPALDLLFVIDEESGGNGALAALNHLKAANSPVIVLEPTGLRPHPANRGALWFKLELSAGDKKSQDVLLMAAAHIVRAISDTGKNIKSLSKHPLFSEDDVQTCFGILGEYGKHPSSACTHLSIEVQLQENSLVDKNLHSCMTSSFEDAVQSGEIIHRSAPPSVETGQDTISSWRLKFISIGGHMGSKARDSDAILKAASTIIRMRQKNKLNFHLPDRPKTLLLEGGQGFLPDCPLENVKEKITHAVESALQHFCTSHGFTGKHFHFSLTFNKLHNRAYCSEHSLAAPLLADAITLVTGVESPPLSGWQASCDARIFAKKFKDVVTFGAGRLEDAHQDNECIHLSDLMKAATAVILTILSSRETTREA